MFVQNEITIVAYLIETNMFNQIDGKAGFKLLGALNEPKNVNFSNYTNVKLQITFIKYH